MLRLLILADTHLPKRAKDLPANVWAAAAAADLVVHAGDWVEAALLDRLLDLGPVLGVYGNNDGPDLRARLPEVAEADLDGLRLSVVHDSGPAAGRDKRCARSFPDSDVLVFGHSHIPQDATVASARPAGLRLLNPGSPTDRRRQPAGTYLTAEVSAGRLRAVRLHTVNPTPRPVRRARTAGSSPPGGTPGSA